MIKFVKQYKIVGGNKPDSKALDFSSIQGSPYQFVFYPDKGYSISDAIMLINYWNRTQRSFNKLSYYELVI